MEPVKAEKQFNKFISVVYTLSFIPIVLFALITVAIIAGVIFVLAVPSSFIEVLQRIPVGELTIQLEEIGVLSSGLTEDLVINKLPIVFVMLSSVVVMVLIFSIMYFINRWLFHLKQGKFFDPKNSRYIEYVGYSIITLGLWYGVQEFAESYFKVDFFESNPEVLERLSDAAIEWGDLLSYTFKIDLMLLFMGILVWIIGRVFKYGTYLQEEYDQTV